MGEATRILYEAITTIANLPEELPEGASQSYLDLQWAATVRSAVLAKRKVDQLREKP